MATVATATVNGASRPASKWPAHDLVLDTSLTHNLLRTSTFAPFQQSVARAEQSFDEMQKNDPLALQIWKFYAKTKQALPQQERMENMTWRMMHVKLNKARAAASAAK